MMARPDLVEAGPQG